MEHRMQCLVRAVHQYGDYLRVCQAMTATTLQGRVETGYVVWGRAHGGDQIGCLYPTRQAAEAAIAAARGRE